MGHNDMNLLHIVVILQFIFQVYGQNLVCQKEVWLPSDGSHYVSPGCEEYDGSLVPDCNYFLNNLTSYFHVHEYDCGKFWECSPSGPCLMKCATCEVSPECPDGTLEFDCRYQYPVGPGCDWPSAVNCTNDNPCDITQVECCSEYDCQPGELCVEGSCVSRSTPTPCPNECCADSDCKDGFICDENGNCIAECPNECCADDDCHGELTCDADGNCQCPTECCSDDDCEGDYICNDDGTCEPKGECGLDRPCDLANGVCDELPYTTCEWCNFEDNSCNPGCETDDNCGIDLICANHICEKGPGINGIVNITIKTASCIGCAGSSDPQGVVEGGVRLFLMGAYGAECTSDGLDNLELVDYKDGRETFFDGKPDDDGSDDGMGECKGHDMNYGLVGGSATWTGPGEWTGAASSPICIKFFDPENNKPTCCCDLAIKTLDLIVDTTDLVNCSCEV